MTVESTALNGLKCHCVKNARVWRFFGLHFCTFGLNTEFYSVYPEAGKCGPEKH